MNLQCNAVFEGGGVRGIGHVGAAYAMEKSGYSFRNVAGSSAGAIVASLIAVGYSAEEMRIEMQNLDYMKFKQQNVFDYFGSLGKLLNIYNNLGIYKTDYFESWLSKLLAKKGKVTFGDIRNKSYSDKNLKYKLQVTASDITDQLLIILPQDLERFGIDPDTFSIAEAVRMSMSIPIFYRPSSLRDSKGVNHLIVDGGLLSNYPIRLLDNGMSNPMFPTFGFKFIEKPLEIKDDEKRLIDTGVVNYLKLIASTALDGHDNEYISKSKGDFERTVAIPVTVKENGKIKYISTTDFSITKSESAKLFENGKLAAEKFLSGWDFNQWKLKYRK